MHTRIRRTAVRNDVQSRVGSLQRLCSIGYGAVGYILGVHHADRPGEVHFLLRTIAHDDHLVQLFGILAEHHAHILRGGYLLRPVADIRHLQALPRSGFYRETPVEISDRTHGCAGNNDVRTDNRLALFVIHRTIHHRGSGSGCGLLLLAQHDMGLPCHLIFESAWRQHLTKQIAHREGTLNGDVGRVVVQHRRAVGKTVNGLRLNDSHYLPQRYTTEVKTYHFVLRHCLQRQQNTQDNSRKEFVFAYH